SANGVVLAFKSYIVCKFDDSNRKSKLHRLVLWNKVDYSSSKKVSYYSSYSCSLLKQHFAMAPKTGIMLGRPKSGGPRTSDDDAGRIHQMFIRSLKSLRCRGGLVGRSRPRDRRVAGLTPDSIENPPCMGPAAR
ncbi:hypothetical protein AVEN_119560-1, partial [Araneus ventricosus]